MNKSQKIHLGVYGIFVKNRAVLLIKKSRGPYQGKYDLPGGRIEFGETLAAALQREIEEEANAQVISYSFLSNEEYFCTYSKEGEERAFHHVGIYFITDLKIDTLRTGQDGHDSDGAEFVHLKNVSLDCVSPIAYKAIKKYKGLS